MCKHRKVPSLLSSRSFCELKAMIDNEDSQICEVLSPRDPLSWTATERIQQSKIVGVISGSSPSVFDEWTF